MVLWRTLAVTATLISAAPAFAHKPGAILHGLSAFTLIGLGLAVVWLGLMLTPSKTRH